MSNFYDVLERLGLSQYHDVFVEEAFDSWDVLVDITETDLDALGVKLGHRRILQRAIAEIRRGSQAPSSSLIDPSLQQDTNRSEDDTASTKAGTAGSTRAKRKYRRHPKPDPHAPERPPSAYVLFSNQVREELKGQELSFTEIAKLVGERWQVLLSEQREPFENKSQALKEKYYQVLAEYKKTPEYEEYRAYLEDFKAKHDPQSQPDDKQARKKKISAASARSDSVERNRCTGHVVNGSTWSEGWPVQQQQADRRASEACSPADASRAVLDWRSQTVLNNSQTYENHPRSAAQDMEYSNSPRYSPNIATQQFYSSYPRPPPTIPSGALPSTSFRPLDPSNLPTTSRPTPLHHPHLPTAHPAREAPSPTSSNTALWPPLSIDRHARRSHLPPNPVPRLPHDEHSSSTTASSTAGSYTSGSTTNTNNYASAYTGGGSGSAASGMTGLQTPSDSSTLGLGSRHLPPPIPTRSSVQQSQQQQQYYSNGSASGSGSSMPLDSGVPPLPHPMGSGLSASANGGVGGGGGAKETSEAAIQASIATLLRAGESLGGVEISGGVVGPGGLPHRAKEASGESNDSEETARQG